MSPQAIFDGEVDASTVKHRLDVLHELQLPVYVTSFQIRGLDPAKRIPPNGFEPTSSPQDKMARFVASLTVPLM